MITLPVFLMVRYNFGAHLFYLFLDARSRFGYIAKSVMHCVGGKIHAKFFEAHQKDIVISLEAQSQIFSKMLCPRCRSYCLPLDDLA